MFVTTGIDLQVPTPFVNKNTLFCNKHDFLRGTFPKEKSHVVVITSDHLGNNEYSFVPNQFRTITDSEKIIQQAERYKNYHFTIIHNCINMDYELPNCKFLHWAPEWITNSNNFSRLNVPGQSEKNFDADYFWVSFNKNKRVQRYLSSMYLLGQNFEKQGYLSLTPDEILEHESFESWIQWWIYNERHEINDIKEFFPILQKGFYKIKNNAGYNQMTFVASESDQYVKLDNFEKNLRPIYVNTVVEVVNETIWFPDMGGVVTEKFLNSVYGYNIPIVNGVRNTLKYLKELEFDLFEDVVDHSYDAETNPVIRLIKALDDNKKLLSDKAGAVTAWKHCKPRMDKNLMLSKDLERNAEQKWNNLISNL